MNAFVQVPSFKFVTIYNFLQENFNFIFIAVRNLVNGF